ncbi:hypothetical protein D1164_19730 [Mariniphaga sediminis]|uniref:50S ribosomal protein L29 n=1 Tax=Mariniphaga sediminis TaxID=1628158 RepID=A0A399CVS3_9BACT|nr:hypothetical protein [Mariniphaga sediminis]RIH63507.1 hypothetical protein D1164_19730 [Mariniphaga sediminis]
MKNSIVKNNVSFGEKELEEALVALTSLIDKCEKAKDKLEQSSSQQTLLKRRIKALQIAVSLIKEKI